MTSRSGSASWSRGSRLVAWSAILLVATAVRLASWGEVLGTGRVVFVVDSDPQYHVLRAERILRELPRLPTFDPSMNHPDGAAILWPPLFDLLIALPGALLGGGREALARVAAFLPVLVGLATLPVVAGLGTALVGPRAGLLAAAVVAILPAHVVYTILGRGDQHGLELLLHAAGVLAFARAWRAPASSAWARWPGTLLLGATLALAFWNWQGSGLSLVVLLGFVAAWYALGVEPETAARAAAVLARGAATGVVLLALSLALALPEALRSTSGSGVTTFHVLLLALTAAAASLLRLAPRVLGTRGNGPRRLVAVLAACLLPLLLALAIPGVRASTLTGLAALTAGNAWYATITEFQPLLLGGNDPWPREIWSALLHWGLVLPLAPVCALALVRRWRHQRSWRPEIALLGWWGVLFLLMAVLRQRFQLYATVPAALWLALAAREAACWMRARHGVHAARSTALAGIVALLLPLIPGALALAPGHFRPDRLTIEATPLLDWLRHAPAPAPGSEAVLAPWSLGHAVRYHAGTPVVTTPFGTDGGEGAMEDAARFYLAPDDEAAEEVLRRRRVSRVLLTNPAGEIDVLRGFAPWLVQAPAWKVRSLWHGPRLYVRDELWSLPVSRLYFLDGSEVPARRLEALPAYRLLYETRPTTPGDPFQEWQLKLFERVPAASLAVRGARPGSRVVATLAFLTNQGRPVRWSTSAAADAAGRATLRVPYATGPNGAIRALAYAVGDGARGTSISVAESQVVGGQTVTVDLAAGG